MHVWSIVRDSLWLWIMTRICGWQEYLELVIKLKERDITFFLFWPTLNKSLFNWAFTGVCITMMLYDFFIHKLFIALAILNVFSVFFIYMYCKISFLCKLVLHLRQVYFEACRVCIWWLKFCPWLKAFSQMLQRNYDLVSMLLSMFHFSLYSLSNSWLHMLPFPIYFESLKISG